MKNASSLNQALEHTVRYALQNFRFSPLFFILLIFIYTETLLQLAVERGTSSRIISGNAIFRRNVRYTVTLSRKRRIRNGSRALVHSAWKRERERERERERGRERFRFTSIVACSATCRSFSQSAFIGFTGLFLRTTVGPRQSS